MTHRKLDAPLTAHRIGDVNGKYPIWSDEGARLLSARWHVAGDPVIYTAEHLSTALLERLAHLGELPPNQHRIEVTLPVGATYEVFADHLAPKWREPGSPDARLFGHAWAQEKRSLLLFVPSVLVPTEQNILINTAHDAFPTLSKGREIPVFWDQRLFSGA